MLFDAKLWNTTPCHLTSIKTKAYLVFLTLKTYPTDIFFVFPVGFPLKMILTIFPFTLFKINLLAFALIPSVNSYSLRFSELPSAECTHMKTVGIPFPLFFVKFIYIFLCSDGGEI